MTDRKLIDAAAAQYGVPSDLLAKLVETESSSSYKGIPVDKVFNVFANCANWCNDSLGYINTVTAASFDEAVKRFIEIETKQSGSGLFDAKFEDLDLPKTINDTAMSNWEDTFDALMQKRELNYYFEGGVDMTYIFKEDGHYSEFVIAVCEVRNVRPALTDGQ
jgi:hypothetical protein